MSTIQTEVSNGIATITLQRPKSLNALTMEGRTLYFQELIPSSIEENATDYDTFAATLREIDKREDVLVTVWQGQRVYAIRYEDNPLM